MSGPRPPRPEAQQEARDYLARAARRLRALRYDESAHVELEWREFKGCPSLGILSAKVGRGEIILWEPTGRGVKYTSSFGPDSEFSYTGLLPGLNLEWAKLLVFREWERHTGAAGRRP